jgi:hypothetical protein
MHPRWWRHRYADEVATITSDLLEEGRSRWRVAGGLAVDALRQWGRGPVPDLTQPLTIQRQVAASAAALPIALVIPLVLYTTSYQRYRSNVLLQMGSMLPTPSWPNPHAFDHRAITFITQGANVTMTPTGPIIHGSMSWPTYMSGVGYFFITVLALVCLFGLLAVWSSMRSALRHRSRHSRIQRFLVWSPAVAMVAIVGLYLWANYLNQQPKFSFAIVHGRPTPVTSVLHPLLAKVVSDSNLILGFGTLAGSLVAMAFLASHVELSTDEARVPLALSRLIGRIVPLMTVAYSLWVLGLRLQGTPTPRGQVIVSYAHSGWWPLALVCLVYVSVVSMRAVGVESRRLQRQEVSITQS